MGDALALGIDSYGQKQYSYGDYVKEYLKEKYNKPGNVYVGLVHRLDRPTGGVMFFAKTNLYLMLIGAAFTLVGYIVIMIQFGANVRDSIPQDKVGLFQGVRMIFFVLILFDFHGKRY